MEHLTIRALCSSDIPIIVKRFSQENWPKPQSTFESYLEEQEIGGRVIWVSCWDKQFVGYITLKWQSSYQPFAASSIPEIMDLNVLPEHRKMGIASQLLEIAEKEAGKLSAVVGLGVGLYGGSDGGYGAAQRLYVKRGYIPDGKGITYNYQFVAPEGQVVLEDDLILWFTKRMK